MTQVLVRGLVRDEGSIVVLWGYELDEADDVTANVVHFAAEHRAAQVILEALEADEPDVTVWLEDWQILSRI